MPKDMYRWEEGGALVHHCCFCKTPLSHEICKTRCLGKHVEWCQRYHTQLFRKDHSSTCAPCKHAEGEHDKRHKKIADMLRQLREVQNDAPPTTPGKVMCIVPETPSPSPMSKKERKAARKTAKLASMPKVITTADIDHVAKVLHPQDSSKDEVEEERHLLEDPDIKLNLYFFKGISNTRESRRRHLKPRMNGEEFVIEEAELSAMLGSLGVPALEQIKIVQARQLFEQIRFAVRDDLIHMAKEHEQTMMRKAGFWRWASRKAYDRLVQNGRLWDDDSASSGIAERKDSVVDAMEDLAVQEDVPNGPQPLQTPGTNVPKTPSSARRKKNDPNIMPLSPAVDDGWTQVGKTTVKRKTEAPISTIKLSGNKGLAKLQVKPKGMFGAFSLADEDFED